MLAEFNVAPAQISFAGIAACFGYVKILFGGRAGWCSDLAHPLSRMQRNWEKFFHIFY